MIQKIHDPKIWKGRDQFLSIKIQNSDQKVCYAFNNGIILISSQIIAETINEEEKLPKILKKCNEIQPKRY